MENYGLSDQRAMQGGSGLWTREEEGLAVGGGSGDLSVQGKLFEAGARGVKATLERQTEAARHR